MKKLKDTYTPAFRNNLVSSVRNSKSFSMILEHLAKAEDDKLKNIAMSCKVLISEIKKAKSELEVEKILKKLESYFKGSQMNELNPKKITDSHIKKISESFLDSDNKHLKFLAENVNRMTSGPFVKEYITPIECLVYILGEENDLRALKDALENPKRPLYIGGSDDFVVISVLDNEPIEIEEIEGDELDSIVRINGEATPIDKTRIVGRVPYRFSEINKKKRDYSREDVVVAAPIPGEKLKLTKPIRCFKIIDDNVAF